VKANLLARPRLPAQPSSSLNHLVARIESGGVGEGGRQVSRGVPRSASDVQQEIKATTGLGVMPQDSIVEWLRVGEARLAEKAWPGRCCTSERSDPLVVAPTFCLCERV
jgi:hypothetical protein